MTAITGKEPPHWHDSRGRHRMTDPRAIEGWHERWWDSDERAYVIHLQTHEQERTAPTRNDDDSPTVQGLFDLLEARRQECARIEELITAHRDLIKATEALHG